MPTARSRTTRDDETGDLVYRATLKYDKFNRLKKFREDTGNQAHLTQYAYDNDNRATKVIYGKAEAENRHVAYSYDGLGRIASQTVTNGAGNAIVSSNTYVAGDAATHGSGATTPLVDTLTHKRGTVGDSHSQIGSEARFGRCPLLRCIRRRYKMNLHQKQQTEGK